MPFYSSRSGFDMPFEALGKGLLAWRTRQQQEKENQRADQAQSSSRNATPSSKMPRRSVWGCLRDEYDLRKRIYDTKTKPFDPSAVPAGMQINKMSMTPDGWSADVAPPPQIPEGCAHRSPLSGSRYRDDACTASPSQPSSRIVELPLPDGSKGDVLTHVDPTPGDQIHPYLHRRVRRKAVGRRHDQEAGTARSRRRPVCGSWKILEDSKPKARA